MFYNEGYHRVLIIKSINYLRDLTQHRLPFQVQFGREREKAERERRKREDGEGRKGEKTERYEM